MARLPELNFRHYIEPRMREEWMMTWHEDREISPGVPDLHYVMKGDVTFRVGWLELKAIDKPIGKTSYIGVEASQHQYIRKWKDHMPIHFLVRIETQVYLIPGAYSTHLALARCLADIKLLSLVEFPQGEIATHLPPILKSITRI